MKNRYIKYVNKYKKRVNPKIAKDIANIIKPYWKLINKTSDYYKLRTLNTNVGKIRVGVKNDVQRLLEAFKLAASAKIEEKIKRLYNTDRKPEYCDLSFYLCYDDWYNIRDMKIFLDKHKINNIHYSTLFNAIYGKMMISLGLEDFKLITNNAKKAKFYSFEVSPILNADELLKPKLKGMNNAILILTGNNETTLDELDYVWQYALKYLPKDGKTTFAYKIDEVNKLQLNLMVVK